MTTPDGSGALLEVRGLTVVHGGLVALDGLDLTVEAGTVVGLIGPNGAGKTTCIDALTGFTAPRSGRISFAGEAIDHLAPHQRVRRGLTRTFQSLELFDDLTVRQNLSVAGPAPDWRSTVGDLFRHRPSRDAAADEALDRLGLVPMAERMPTDLSNGQRHLVALARALVSGPRLVLLDEPAAGLDPAETLELSAVVRDLPARGTSVLLVDHDMSLVMGVCDAVAVLDFGQLIAVGPPSTVRADPAVVTAYLGDGSATP